MSGAIYHRYELLFDRLNCRRRTRKGGLRRRSLTRLFLCCECYYFGFFVTFLRLTHCRMKSSVVNNYQVSIALWLSVNNASKLLGVKIIVKPGVTHGFIAVSISVSCGIIITSYYLCDLLSCRRRTKKGAQPRLRARFFMTWHGMT